jgi:hypothetical protein
VGTYGGGDENEDGVKQLRGERTFVLLMQGVGGLGPA